MNIFCRYIILCFISWAMAGSSAIAQDLLPTKEISSPTDDLGNLSDRFQELFFEALKQKAITNYDKAIEALEACVEMNPNEVILYSELGKNHLSIKQYNKAEEYFTKVLESKPNDRYVLELLYETYLKQNKYTESVKVIEQLVQYSTSFKEQLVNLYYLERRYDDALMVLDEITEELGSDSYRDSLRKKITLKLTNPSQQINRLKDKIESGKNSEQNYLNLIYLHSQSSNTKEAYKVAEQLLKQYPKSELVHLALYKFYLDDNKTDEAIASMRKVLKGEQIDEDAKYKVVSDFLLFVNDNPQYESQLEELIGQLSQSQNGKGKIFTELGHYYFKKDQKELALNYYERGITANANDLDLLKRILLLQLDLKRYEKAKVGSNLALEMYPANPIFYLINGVSDINLNQPAEAIEVLSAGMDYIIDDIKMESDFYMQMSRAFEIQGNTDKASEYKEKALQLHKKS